MPEWKKNIFVRVVNKRIQDEGKTAEEILLEYPALTDDEKTEILAALQTLNANQKRQERRYFLPRGDEEWPSSTNYPMVPNGPRRPVAMLKTENW